MPGINGHRGSTHLDIQAAPVTLAASSDGCSRSPTMPSRVSLDGERKGRTSPAARLDNVVRLLDYFLHV
jgi:hypothetical protein